jgi:DNA-binding transcriptional LysR family regulator
MVRYSARSHTGMQIDRHLSRLGLRPTRRLEMDTSESVFPMVAEGVGWAITTPLCVFHGRPDLDHIELLPLPGPKFSRQVVLAHRRGEYDDLADNIAQMTWSAIEAQILPAVRRTIPHALPDMTFDRGEVPAMTGPYRRPVFRRVL